MCKSGQDNSEGLKEEKNVLAIAMVYKVLCLLHFLTSTVVYV